MASTPMTNQSYSEIEVGVTSVTSVLKS